MIWFGKLYNRGSGPRKISNSLPTNIHKDIDGNYYYLIDGKKIEMTVSTVNVKELLKRSK